MSDAPTNLVDLSAVRAAGRDRSAFVPLVSFEGRPGACECSDFVLGVEIGRLTSALEDRPPSWRGTYHAANRLMLERVAAAYRYSAALEDSGTAGWVFATFTPLP